MRQLIIVWPGLGLIFFVTQYVYRNLGPDLWLHASVWLLHLLATFGLFWLANLTERRAKRQQEEREADEQIARLVRLIDEHNRTIIRLSGEAHRVEHLHRNRPGLN